MIGIIKATSVLDVDLIGFYLVLIQIIVTNNFR